MSHRRFLSVALLLSAFGLAASPSAHAQCGHFRRGDANADAAVDLSDAVFTLLFLFTGGAPPSCLAAADADDSGAIELTDAVYTLGYLFLAQPSPPAPGPIDCGTDDTADALGCEAYEACEPPVELRDHSTFTSFEYRQTPALGFCPDEGRVFDATILRQADGSYRLELALVRWEDTNAGECLFQLPPEFGCFVREPLPARELTAAEAAALRSAFSAVAVHPAPAAFCACIVIDPCAVGSFAWDGVETSHFPCAASFVDADTVNAVLALLESFRAGG